MRRKGHRRLHGGDDRKEQVTASGPISEIEASAKENSGPGVRVIRICRWRDLSEA